MWSFGLRRLVLAIPTILGVTLLVFVIMMIMPGDVAFYILAGPTGDPEAVSPEQLARLRVQLGLDRPLFEQYFAWLGSFVQFDFGDSLRNGRPIGPDLLRRFPLTAQLALMGIVVGIIIGIPVGIFAAIRQDRFADYALRSVAFLGHSVPNFWLGLLVLLFLVGLFNWSPPFGMNTLWSNPKDNLSQLSWPALVLGYSFSGSVARMTRSTMLEVLREDYVRTARAKGLSEQIVITRHALKNALIPVVTIIGTYFGALLGGTVVMELIFSVPGWGTLLLDSMRIRDFPVVMAVVALIAVFFIVINVLLDLAMAWLDPRIRVY